MKDNTKIYYEERGEGLMPPAMSEPSKDFEPAMMSMCRENLDPFTARSPMRPLNE